MSNTESQKAELDAKVRDIQVERKKHVVWIVGGGDNSPGVTYTSGCAKARLPDLYIPGYIGPLGGHILNAVVYLMRHRLEQDPSDKLTGVFICQDFKVKGEPMRVQLDVATIAQAKAAECNAAFWSDLPEQRHFRIIHLPDTENRLPGDEGYVNPIGRSALN